MLKITSILVVFFTEKITGRFIVAIIRFFLILMFAPESLSVYLAERTNMPYAMQIFCFTLTVSATLILDKVSFYVIRLFRLVCDFIKKRSSTKGLAR
ncbi:hypothetical protein FFT88_23870 [Escherichia sp. E4930]|uniref:hypothetical protein n=1 Tax=Escherichia sp. E4930 TaxID=2044468 RepID=UPI00107F5985|nr:hypothetical protein [Escherichia sp. E4930]TGB71777.1 hypothetical protein CRG96_02250 [Escherichia sp. E4930]TLU76984.1 hypothetical protein FFT88_23870 [Escherichia sp. E4930]